MKTYSLSEKSCSNCNLGPHFDYDEAMSAFAGVLSAYDFYPVVASHSPTKKAYANYWEEQIDEWFDEGAIDFYLCCFEETDETNDQYVCNNPECSKGNYSYAGRFTDTVSYYRTEIQDAIKAGDVYYAGVADADYPDDALHCQGCEHYGTTRCVPFLNWIREYNVSDDGTVIPRIQRCNDFKATIPVVAKPNDEGFSSQDYEELDSFFGVYDIDSF